MTQKLLGYIFFFFLGSFALFRFFFFFFTYYHFLTDLKYTDRQLASPLPAFIS